jgi:ribosomal protein L35AE/L33A
MDNTNLIGMTIVFEDESDGTDKYGQIINVSGNDGVLRLISKKESGPRPRRVKFKPKP